MSQTPTTTFDIKELFEKALKEYESRTGTILLEQELAITLQSCDSADTVIEALQTEAKKFQKFRGDDGKVMKWLNRTVNVLYSLSTNQIVGQAVGFVPFPPAQAIFAGIGVLLAAIKDVSASYDALIDLFEFMESFLRRLDIYTKIPSTQAMHEILLKILIELLSALAIATQQVKQGRLKKFGKKLFGENDVESVLQRFDRLTREEAKTTAAETLEVAYRLVKSMKEVMDGGKVQTDGIREALVALHEMASNMNKEKRDKSQRISRKWLSPPDPSINHNTLWDIHHDGTAAWFIDGNTFPDWMARGSLLWIHGNPGSGKSVLCSTIIQNIEVMREAGLASLAYFYFDFKDDAKKGIRGILTSLLVQLSARSDPCCDILSALYSEHDSGSRQPSDDRLTRCLKEMLTIPRQGPMYIIVDGVDECPNQPKIRSPRESVLRLLKELVLLRYHDLYIGVTSRPEPDIDTILRPLLSHEVSLHEELGQNQDIIDYVKAVVKEKMSNWSAENKQLVIETLSGKADGMFRWVFCQLETLCGCHPGHIRRTLEELPGNLDETYERALGSIDNKIREYAILLFQCITVASRPLRVKELAEFLAIKLDADTNAVLTFVEEWRPLDARDAILSTCSSLITVVDDSVQFSHFSVKEFLTSNRLSLAREPSITCYYISLKPAHNIVAQACLSLLLQLDKRTIHGHWTLADYSAQHWVGHSQFEGVSSHVRVAMESLFNPNKPYFAIWVSMWDVDERWYTGRQLPTFGKLTPTPLYYAALCGFHELVELLIFRRPQDVHTWGGRRATPLHAASTQGHLEVARLLLNNGAIVNSKGNSDHTPLHAAAKEGHLEIVTLLLEKNANVNAKNARQKTPLLRAAKRGHLDVVRTLLLKSADVQARDSDGQSALHLAALMGHSETVTLLLEYHANVDAKDAKERTPLLRAAERGHSQVTRALLLHSAYVQARDEDGQTALHLAAVMGHSETAMLLLKHGANVNAQSTETALLAMEGIDLSAQIL